MTKKRSEREAVTNQADQVLIESCGVFALVHLLCEYMRGNIFPTTQEPRHNESLV